MTVKEMQSCVDLPVMVADHDGIVTYVNKRFEEVFGWTANESVGQPLTMVIPSELHDAHNMGFSRFLASGKARILNTALTLKAVNKAGKVFDAEHYIVAEKNDKEEWLIAASMEPIEGEKS